MKMLDFHVPARPNFTLQIDLLPEKAQQALAGRNKCLVIILLSRKVWFRKN